MHHIKILPLLFLVIALGGCSLFENDEKEKPEELPLSVLETAPQTITIDGVNLSLSTFMWRDFMPIAPADGRPLVAIFRIKTPDSTAVPQGLEAEAAWVVHGGEIWATYFADTDTPPSEIKPWQIYKVARDGPKLGPHVFVDAIVRLKDASGKSYLLRAPKQYISRTD